MVLSQKDVSGDFLITTFVLSDKPGKLATEIRDVLIRDGHDIEDDPGSP